MLLAADGKYEFTFPREQVERYIIEVQKEGYFSIIEDIYFSSLTLEQDNIRNYSTHTNYVIFVTSVDCSVAVRYSYS